MIEKLETIDNSDIRENRHREFRSTPWIAMALSLLIIGSVIYKVFNLSIFGVTFQGAQYLLLLISCFLPLIFIWFPGGSFKNIKIIPWYDYILALISFVVPFYLFLNAMKIQNFGWGSGTAPFAVQVMCLIFIIPVLEATRRLAGKSLFLICLFFAVFPLFAEHMPGLLAGISFPFWRAISLHVMGGDSLLGMVMQVIGNIVVGYLIFGVFFQITGGGSFFLELATCLLGRFRGGSAKVAVLASSLFGSMSGAVVSNVITTGTITIPAMKKEGFPGYFAAAIEACSSTGGSIMPPVMGSAAFFCAQFLGIPYYQVALGAVIPSLLYYTGLLIQVDSYAAKTGKKGIEKKYIPSLKKTLKEGWYYFFAIVIMVYFIFMRQESKAPFYAVAILLVLSMITKKNRLTINQFKIAILDTGKSVAEICAILLGVGFIVGSLSITGVAHSFSYEVVRIAGNNLALLLILGAAASFVLGMGMVSSAAYLFLALTLAPALIKMGVYPLSAHMFVMYCGIISFITPPVALGAMAAAGVASAPSTKTGFKAMELGIGIYIVPFALVINPSLVGNGPIWKIILSILLSIFGMAFICGSLQGRLFMIKGTVDLPERFILAIAGILLFSNIWQLVIIGIFLGIILVILKKYK